MTKKLTSEEVSQSLTGFDEIAIKQKFGSPVGTLGTSDATQLLRALVFTLLRRDGKNDVDAYREAQEATLAQIGAHFATPKEKADADFPEQPPTTTP